MIIGINGKIGSGKDTVARIIQSKLQKKEDSDMGFPTWEIKRYAQKLKEIASTLTGIPVEKFEDQEFKKTTLPEIWDRWGVWHLHNDGASDEKSYFEQYFSTQEEAQDYWQKHEDEAKEYNESHTGSWMANFRGVKKVSITVRELLQLLGTEAMRDVIHPNVWVNALFADYVGVGKGYKEYIGHGDYKEEGEIVYPNWIITDMRFPNEMKAIKDRGGITLRVTRPNNPYPASDHPSETSLDDAKFDVEIINNSTLQHLLENIEDEVAELKLW